MKIRVDYAPHGVIIRITNSSGEGSAIFLTHAQWENWLYSLKMLGVEINATEVFGE